MSDTLKGQVLLAVVSLMGFMLTAWQIRHADKRARREAAERQAEIRLQIELAETARSSAHEETKETLKTVGQKAEAAYAEANSINEKIASHGEALLRLPLIKRKPKRKESIR